MLPEPGGNDMWDRKAGNDRVPRLLSCGLALSRVDCWFRPIGAESSRRIARYTDSQTTPAMIATTASAAPTSVT
jgi:hypothetical protein